MESSWNTFGILLESSWNPLGIILESLWNTFGIRLTFANNSAVNPEMDSSSSDDDDFVDLPGPSKRGRQKQRCGSGDSSGPSTKKVGGSGRGASVAKTIEEKREAARIRKARSRSKKSEAELEEERKKARLGMAKHRDKKTVEEKTVDCKEAQLRMAKHRQEKIDAEREKSRMRMQLQRQKIFVKEDASTYGEEDVTDEETSSDNDNEEEVTDGELEWLEKDLEALIKEEDRKTNTRKMMKKTYFQMQNLRRSKADTLKKNGIQNLRDGYLPMQPPIEDFQKMKELMAEVVDVYNSDSDPDYISPRENNKKRMAEKRKQLTEEEKDEIRRKDRERKSKKKNEMKIENPTTSKPKKMEDYYMFDEKEHNRKYKQRVRAERSEAEVEFDKIETAIAVRKYRADGKEYLQWEIYLENFENEDFKKMIREKFRRDPYKKKEREVFEIEIWESYYDCSSENKDVLKKRKPEIFAKIEDSKREESEISEEDEEESEISEEDEEESEEQRIIERRRENADRAKKCRERKQALLQKPIDIPDLPKSEYELLRDKNVKELEEMKRACGFFDN